jgi:hypothetical protein
VQMLWHLLPHRARFFETNFPEIRIADRQNSLQQTDVHAQHGLYAEMNNPIHAAVIGNPPYVRPERNTQALYGHDAQFYADIGSTDKNLFSLFIYKALKGWCRPQSIDSNGKLTEAGYLAFVVPLSFCDNDDNAPLRKQFEVGGAFRLVEIIDMEVIAPFVFDAAVNPIVLIAQNRPALATDTVTLRLADERCIVDKKARLFDLDKSTRNEFAYNDIWTSEGNILTRLTEESLPILQQLATLPKLESVAQKFWTGKQGASIVKWQIDKPKGLNAANEGKGIRWEQQEMIRMGCAFRGKTPLATASDKAFTFFKGENISAGAVEGTAQKVGVDIDGIDDNALWRFRNILPERGFAFLQITLGLTCAPFDPSKLAFLNTATLFFPQKSLAKFPFDLLLLSRVYQYNFALSLRQGAVSKLWSHLYTRNLRQLPWSDALIPHGKAIEALRPEYERLCKAVHNRRAALLEALSRLGCTPWGVLARSLQAKIKPSEAFDGRESVLIDQPRLSDVSESGTSLWRIQFNGDLLAYVDVTHEAAAQALFAVLTLWQGDTRSYDQLLSLDVPNPIDATNAQTLQAWQAAIDGYDAGGSKAALDALFDQIDGMVGDALGLSPEQIQTIQTSMKSDAFLRHIRPSLPHAGRAQRGLSASLAATDRYEGEVSQT